ncbi:MAG: sensor of ECF-type sigma factor [Flavobacterium sp.]
MKNYKLLIVSVFLISIASFGQNRPLRERFKEKKEQVKALKVAFITTELNLTPEESAKFWPIFNAFEDKQQEIKKQKLRALLDRTDGNVIDKLSEKEAATLLTQMESTEDELYQLKKKFVASLKGILPATKILKLKKAEEQFSKKLLQQYRDKKIGR